MTKLLGPAFFLLVSVFWGCSSPKSPEQHLGVETKEISQELGLTSDVWERATETLAKGIANDREVVASCQKEEGIREICDLVRWFHQDEKEPKRSKRLPRIQEKDLLAWEARSLDWNPAFTKITLAQLKRWTAKLLQATSSPCPRNFSWVLWRRWEMELPRDEARNSLEALFGRIESCLKPTEISFEQAYFRMGLLSQMWGKTSQAASLIYNATRAEKSVDRPRVLYWAGALSDSVELKEKLWGQLLERYPLSYHALEVWASRRVDPLLVVEARPPIVPRRDIASGSSEVDRGLRWIESLYLQKFEKQAEELTNRYMDIFREQIPIETIYYVATLKNLLAPIDTSVRFLSRQVSLRPTLLSKGTLEMLFPAPYLDEVQRAAGDLDPRLILSIARQESAFNPRARSPANAMGVLQLLPSTAKRLNGGKKPDLYNPEVNIRLGAIFFRNLVDRFGSVELALAAYNAGPGRVVSWVERYGTQDMLLFVDLIPFGETRTYVASILRNHYWYSRLNQSETIPSSLSSRLVGKILANTRNLDGIENPVSR